MSLKNRMGKLEEQAGPLRCDECRAWPETRLMTQTEDDPITAIGDTPECCPDCGWEPITIVIHYTEEAGRL